MFTALEGENEMMVMPETLSVTTPPREVDVSLRYASIVKKQKEKKTDKTKKKIHKPKNQSTKTIFKGWLVNCVHVNKNFFLKKDVPSGYIIAFLWQSLIKIQFKSYIWQGQN